jgi:hypothetical protein
MSARESQCVETAENLMNNYYLNQTPSIEEVKTDANLALREKYREEHKPRGISRL